MPDKAEATNKASVMLSRTTVNETLQASVELEDKTRGSDALLEDARKALARVIKDNGSEDR